MKKQVVGVVLSAAMAAVLGGCSAEMWDGYKESAKMYGRLVGIGTDLESVRADMAKYQAELKEFQAQYKKLKCDGSGAESSECLELDFRITGHKHEIAELKKLEKKAKAEQAKKEASKKSGTESKSK